MDISSKFRLGAAALAISTSMASPGFARGEGGICASLLAFADIQRSVWSLIDVRNVDGGRVGEFRQIAGGQTLNGPCPTPSQGWDEGSMTIQFSSTTATLTIPSGRQIPLPRYTF